MLKDESAVKMERQCEGVYEGSPCLTQVGPNAASCWKCGGTEFKTIRHEEAPETDTRISPKGITPANSVGTMGDHECTITEGSAGSKTGVPIEEGYKSAPFAREKRPWSERVANIGKQIMALETKERSGKLSETNKRQLIRLRNIVQRFSDIPAVS